MHRYNLPTLNDTMLSGVCGLAAIAFACVTIYLYACFRTVSNQLWLNLNIPVRATNEWARWLMLTLGSAWIAALAIMFTLLSCT